MRDGDLGTCPDEGGLLCLPVPDEPGRPLPEDGGRLLPAEGGRLFAEDGRLFAEDGRLLPAEGGRLGEVARPEVDPTANADASSMMAVWDLVRPWTGKGGRAPFGSGGLPGGGNADVVDC